MTKDEYIELASKHWDSLGFKKRNEFL